MSSWSSIVQVNPLNSSPTDSESSDGPGSIVGVLKVLTRRFYSGLITSEHGVLCAARQIIGLIGYRSLSTLEVQDQHIVLDAVEVTATIFLYVVFPRIVQEFLRDPPANIPPACLIILKLLAATDSQVTMHCDYRLQFRMEAINQLIYGHASLRHFLLIYIPSASALARLKISPTNPRQLLPTHPLRNLKSRTSSLLPPTPFSPEEVSTSEYFPIDTKEEGKSPPESPFRQEFCILNHAPQADYSNNVQATEPQIVSWSVNESLSLAIPAVQDLESTDFNGSNHRHSERLISRIVSSKKSDVEDGDVVAEVDKENRA
ncbi:hypothetical protein C8J56DRAFT_1059229 [Mycena floridula]|nr:hypothetical protein C8J56DRAFT_1059229 [Mycena floridula]